MSQFEFVHRHFLSVKWSHASRTLPPPSRPPPFHGVTYDRSTVKSAEERGSSSASLPSQANAGTAAGSGSWSVQSAKSAGGEGVEMRALMLLLLCDA